MLNTCTSQDKRHVAHAQLTHTMVNLNTLNQSFDHLLTITHHTYKKDLIKGRDIPLTSVLKKGSTEPRIGRNLTRACFFGGHRPICAVSTGRWAPYHAAPGIELRWSDPCGGELRTSGAQPQRSTSSQEIHQITKLKHKIAFVAMHLEDKEDYN